MLAVCLTLSCALARSAEAAPPRRVALHFTRGDSAQTCIDPVTLARQVEAFTGPVLSTPSDADAAIEAHIEAKPEGGFRARIRLALPGAAPHGERTLEDESADCRSFDRALAFVIATTIDPDLALERVGALFRPSEQTPGARLLTELERAAPAVPDPAPVPPVVKEAAIATSAPTEARARIPIAFGLGISGSSELPKLALGPAFSVRIRVLEWLELGVSTRIELALHDKPIADHRSARTQVFAAAVLACPRWPVLRDRLALSFCAGPEGALVRARGVGYADNRAGTLPLWAAHLRAESTIRVADHLELALAGFGRFTHRKIKLSADLTETQQTFFVSSPVAWGGELSVRRHF